MKKFLFSKSVLIFFLIFIFSLPVLFPLLRQGFFVTDDGEWMIIRFSAFYQALSDGQFPVRFLHRLNFEYGYPVATFLYPGFMYAAVFFHVLKIGLVETIKIILALSFVGTAIFTYFWLEKLFTKKSAAFLGAVVSLYVPYHLYDVYTRGSVGEIFALLWVPFILWMMERKNIFFVTVGLSLLLISHNTIALFFFPVLFFYGLLRKIFSLKQLLFIFLGGVLLSAFFIIPAVFELSLTSFANTVISDPKNYFADISLIGIATFLIFIFAGGLFIFQKKSAHEHTALVRFFSVITLLAILFSSEYSKLIWQYLPSTVIQFPFRLLSYLLISIPFLTAFIIAGTTGITKKAAIILIALISFGSAYQFMTPKEYTDKGNGYYLTNEATTTIKDEYMPLWVQTKPTDRPTEKIVITQGRGNITNNVVDNKKITFSIEATETSRVRINTLYWPGWEAFMDKQKTSVLYNNPEGVMELIVPKGNHQITVEFHETLVRLTSNLISLLTFFVLLGVVFVPKLKKV